MLFAEALLLPSGQRYLPPRYLPRCPPITLVQDAMVHFMMAPTPSRQAPRGLTSGTRPPPTTSGSSYQIRSPARRAAADLAQTGDGCFFWPPVDDGVPQQR